MGQREVDLRDGRLETCRPEFIGAVKTGEKAAVVLVALPLDHRDA
jgi:hypothetical protein